MKRILLTSLLLFLIPMTAFAVQRTQQHVVVEKGDVIDANFFAAGQSVEVNGDVNGDVIVAGATVEINGTVAGDVIAAGQTIRIRGTVEGNIRLAGATVEVEGAIGKNASIFASTIDIAEEASIGWSLQAFASSLTLDGPIAGDLHFFGASAILRAPIGGSATVRLGEEGTLVLRSPASIGRDLTYESSSIASIPEGVTIGGEVRHMTPTIPTFSFEIFSSFWIFFKLATLFGALLVGLILLSVIPKGVRRVTKLMREKPGASIGWGFLFLIVSPIAFILLLMTVVGIPAALIGFGFYAIIAYFGEVLTALFLGLWLLSLGGNKEPRLLWSMILGGVIYSLLTWVPVLGWLVGLVGTAWGFGAILLYKKHNIQESERA